MTSDSQACPSIQTMGVHAVQGADPKVDPHSGFDVDAFVTELVSQYSSMLQRVARSVTHDTVEAEEVVQDTFLRVLRHRHKLAEIQEPRSWLVRITWNLALDRKRRAKTRPQSEGFEECARMLPTGEMSAGEEADRV